MPLTFHDTTDNDDDDDPVVSDSADADANEPERRRVVVILHSRADRRRRVVDATDDDAIDDDDTRRTIARTDDDVNMTDDSNASHSLWVPIQIQIPQPKKPNRHHITDERTNENKKYTLPVPDADPLTTTGRPTASRRGRAVSRVTARGVQPHSLTRAHAQTSSNSTPSNSRSRSHSTQSQHAARDSTNAALRAMFFVPINQSLLFTHTTPHHHITPHL